MTPERIFRPTMAINAAYAMFWADKYGMREFAGPYRFGRSESDGSALLKIWQQTPGDPFHDNDLIDRSGERLRLTDWYRWVLYEPPQYGGGNG